MERKPVANIGLMKYQNILTSYLIGVPIGLLTVLIFLLAPSMLTGEGLATIAIIGTYGKAILGLVISFLIALGIGGHYIAVNIEKRRTLLSTSFRYSLTVNFIIWTVFVLLTIAGNEKKDLWLVLIPPIVAFLICTTITTFTLGLFICYVVRQKINRITVR